ncbi:MAG: FAD-dependent oxidoreductase, partial [Elusimicrobia bacterium]|nr:FAD-dependent oxidoreductase [Elusimicrobiota bacterium]
IQEPLLEAAAISRRGALTRAPPYSEAAVAKALDEYVLPLIELAKNSSPEAAGFALKLLNDIKNPAHWFGQDVKVRDHAKNYISGNLPAMGDDGSISNFSFAFPLAVIGFWSGHGLTIAAGLSLFLLARFWRKSINNPGSNASELSRVSPEFTSAGLGEFSYDGRRLFFKGRPCRLLGKGGRGEVYLHPEHPGVIVKVPALDAMNAIASTIEKIFGQDAEYSRRLAAAGDPSLTGRASPEAPLVSPTLQGPATLSAGPRRGAAGLGPRFLGQGMIVKVWPNFWKNPIDFLFELPWNLVDRHTQIPVLIKELVAGETLAEIVRQRKFGDEEKALLDELLSDMAREGIQVATPEPDNVMFGVTRANSRRRAYIINGNRLESMEPDMPFDIRLAALWDQPWVLKQGFSDFVGYYQNVVVLRDYVAGSLDSSRPKPAPLVFGYGRAVKMLLSRIPYASHDLAALMEFLKMNFASAGQSPAGRASWIDQARQAFPALLAMGQFITKELPKLLLITLEDTFPKHVSYWLRNGNPFRDYPVQPIPRKVKYLIIGAGITGAAHAHRFAEAIEQGLAPQGARVAVLEAQQVASGASGRNMGSVTTAKFSYKPLIGVVAGNLRERFPEMPQEEVDRRARDTVKALIRAMMKGAERVKALAAEVKEKTEFDPHYNQAGWVDLAQDEEDFALMKESFDMAREDGFTSWQLLSSDEASRMIGASGKTGGIFYPESAVMDPVEFTAGLMELALLKGRSPDGKQRVELYQNTKVKKVEALPGGGYRVHTNKGVIEAEVVIDATEAHTSRREPALASILRPYHTQGFAATPGAPQLGRRSISSGFFYMKQIDDETALMGTGYAPVRNPWRLFESPIIRYFAVGKFFEIFGQALRIKNAWGGYIGITPDWMPLVGRLPLEGGNRWGVLGLGGYGNALAPPAAEQNVDEILGIRGDRPYPPEHFSPSRFKHRAASTKRIFWSVTWPWLLFLIPLALWAWPNFIWAGAPGYDGAGVAGLFSNGLSAVLTGGVMMFGAMREISPDAAPAEPGAEVLMREFMETLKDERNRVIFQRRFCDLLSLPLSEIGGEIDRAASSVFRRENQLAGKFEEFSGKPLETVANTYRQIKYGHLGDQLKLPVDQEIFRLRILPVNPAPQTEIARRFGLSQRSISNYEIALRSQISVLLMGAPKKGNSEDSLMRFKGTLTEERDVVIFQKRALDLLFTSPGELVKKLGLLRDGVGRRLQILARRFEEFSGRPLAEAANQYRSDRYGYWAQELESEREREIFNARILPLVPVDQTTVGQRLGLSQDAVSKQEAALRERLTVRLQKEKGPGFAVGSVRSTDEKNKSEVNQAAAIVLPRAHRKHLSQDEQAALAIRMKAGDGAALNELIATNQAWIVASVVQYCKRFGVPQDLWNDAIQETNLKFLEVLQDGYDPARGAFTTYVRIRVKGFVWRWWHKINSDIRVPEHQQKRTGRARQVSLDEPESDDSGRPLKDLLRAADNTEDNAALAEAVKLIEAFAATLDGHDRLIWDERIASDDLKPKTLPEVGEMIGKNREWVRQREIELRKKFEKFCSQRETIAASTPRPLRSLAAAAAGLAALLLVSLTPATAWASGGLLAGGDCTGGFFSLGAAMEFLRGTLIFWLVIESIILHEVGHAWVAEKMGDISARMAGQISLSPWRYMNPISASMLFFTSLFGVPLGVLFTVLQGSFEKPMYKGRLALVAMAGPAVNLLLAAPMIIMPFAFHHFWPQLFDLLIFKTVMNSLWMAGVINVALGVSNLIPIGPIDGRMIARGLAPKKWIKLYDKITVVPGLIALLGVVIWVVWITVSAAIESSGANIPIVAMHSGEVVSSPETTAVPLSWWQQAIEWTSGLDPFMTALVSMGSLIWIVAMIPVVNNTIAAFNSWRHRRRVIKAGGYQFKINVPVIRQKMPTLKVLALTLAVPWTGDGFRPAGIYKIHDPQAIKLKTSGPIQLMDGSRARLDEAMMRRIKAHEFALLEVDGLQGSAFEYKILNLLPAASVGGLARLQALIETSAVAQALEQNQGLKPLPADSIREPRHLLTKKQVQIVKRLSRYLGAPVYDLDWNPSAAHRQLGSYVDIENGPAFFIRFSTLVALEKLPSGDREGALLFLERYLSRMREAAARGRSLVQEHEKFLQEQAPIENYRIKDILVLVADMDARRALGKTAGAAPRGEGPAMTRSGRELSDEEHAAIINPLIEAAFKAGLARRVAERTPEFGFFDPNEDYLRSKEVSMYVIDGTVDQLLALAKQSGIRAPPDQIQRILADLVVHPGRSRKSVYYFGHQQPFLAGLDPESRSQIVRHELAHLRFRWLNEWQIQMIAPLPGQNRPRVNGLRWIRNDLPNHRFPQKTWLDRYLDEPTQKDLAQAFFLAEDDHEMETVINRLAGQLEREGNKYLHALVTSRGDDWAKALARFLAYKHVRRDNDVDWLIARIKATRDLWNYKPGPESFRLGPERDKERDMREWLENNGNEIVRLPIHQDARHGNPDWLLNEILTEVKTLHRPYSQGPLLFELKKALRQIVSFRYAMKRSPRAINAALAGKADEVPNESLILIDGRKTLLTPNEARRQTAHWSGGDWPASLAAMTAKGRIENQKISVLILLASEEAFYQEFSVESMGGEGRMFHLVPIADGQVIAADEEAGGVFLPARWTNPRLRRLRRSGLSRSRIGGGGLGLFGSSSAGSSGIRFCADGLSVAEIKVIDTILRALGRSGNFRLLDYERDPSAAYYDPDGIYQSLMQGSGPVAIYEIGVSLEEMMTMAGVNAKARDQVRNLLQKVAVFPDVHHRRIYYFEHHRRGIFDNLSDEQMSDLARHALQHLDTASDSHGGFNHWVKLAGVSPKTSILSDGEIRQALRPLGPMPKPSIWPWRLGMTATALSLLAAALSFHDPAQYPGVLAIGIITAVLFGPVSAASGVFINDRALQWLHGRSSHQAPDSLRDAALRAAQEMRLPAVPLIFMSSGMPSPQAMVAYGRDLTKGLIFSSRFARWPAPLQEAAIRHEMAHLGYGHLRDGWIYFLMASAAIALAAAALLAAAPWWAPVLVAALGAAGGLALARTAEYLADQRAAATTDGALNLAELFIRASTDEIQTSQAIGGNPYAFYQSGWRRILGFIMGSLHDMLSFHPSPNFRIARLGRISREYQKWVNRVAPRVPDNLLDIPFVRQATGYSCGAAALLAALYYWGDYSGKESDLYGLLQTNEENGTDVDKIVTGARSFGLQARAEENLAIEDLRLGLARGETMILMLQAWPDEGEPAKPWREMWENGHFVVLAGMDEHFAYVMDPTMTQSYAYMPLWELEDRWHDEEKREGNNAVRFNHLAIFIRGGKPNKTPPPLASIG